MGYLSRQSSKVSLINIHIVTEDRVILRGNTLQRCSIEKHGWSVEFRKSTQAN